MSQALRNPESNPIISSTFGYSDFERQELAIALNSKKRGDVVIALVQEEQKDNPDIEKIARLNQESKELIFEKQEIYFGNVAIQNKVIETYKHG